MTTDSPFRPIGDIGLPLYSGYLRIDPNPRLTGLEAVRVYRDMAYNEPACRAFLSACTNLLGAAPQAVPGGQSDADKEAAAHLQACVDGMDVPVATAMRQMYSMLWAGWCIHETVLRRRDDGTIGWAEWGLRRQTTLDRWLTDPATGRISGWSQRPEPSYRLRDIPASRYIHIVADDSEGSPEGISTLRGMYRPWRIVQNLEMFMGISAERFGTGLPIFEVDAAVGRLTDSDEAILQAIGASLRQNEEAYLILPPGVRFRFAESPGLDVATYLDIIRYLRLVMLSTQMADFIGLGTQNAGGGGSYALGKDKSEMFLLALNGYQDRAMEAINRQAVARLYALPANRVNRFGAITAPPRLTLPPVKRYDLEAIGGLLTVLNSVGAWTPTAEDESYLRKISDLLDRTPAQITAAREEAEEEVEEQTGGDAPAQDEEPGDTIDPEDAAADEAMEDIDAD